MEIRIFIPVEPVAKGRPKFTKQGFCYTPKKTSHYEKQIKYHLEASGYGFKEMYDKPIHLKLDFFIARPKSVKREFPCTRPDIDNYAKAVLDAMNGIVFKDDGQIVSLLLTKSYHEKPGILIVILG